MATTRTEWIAHRLRAILDKAEVTPEEIERRTANKGMPPVSAVTVRRILKATARTEPERVTLERIAEAVGVPYAEAFPEWDPDPVVRVERAVATLKALLEDEEVRAALAKLPPDWDARRLIEELPSLFPADEHNRAKPRKKRSRR